MFTRDLFCKVLDVVLLSLFTLPLCKVRMIEKYRKLCYLASEMLVQYPCHNEARVL